MTTAIPSAVISSSSPSPSPNPFPIDSTKAYRFIFAFDTVDTAQLGSFGAAKLLYNGTNVVARVITGTDFNDDNDKWFAIQDSQAPSATSNLKLAIQNVLDARNLSDGILGDIKDPDKYRWDIQKYAPRPLPTSSPESILKSADCCFTISATDDNNTTQYLSLPDAFIRTALPTSSNQDGSESYLIFSKIPTYPIVMQSFSVSDITLPPSLIVL